MDVDVVLPSGGRLPAEFAAEAGAEVKALVKLGGRTLLERTVATLRETRRIGRVVVVGPDELAPAATAARADALLPEGASGTENILRGLDWLARADGRHAERVLVVTTDLPFLTAEAITTFLDACPPELAVCVPITDRAGFTRGFPDFPLAYLRLHDGEWTMGCAFLVDPQALLANRARLEAAFGARKSGLAMMRLLGLRFIWRFVTHRLTSADVEGRCASLLGCPGGAVRDCPPELVFDIDEPAEYRYAREQLGSGVAAEVDPRRSG